ncbi:hypothetical protein HK099_006337 [Clydaea vesicula]|uniref:Cilia- and flagella-associated protein 157 n=1 Tax=Clydaea vesicula TaxID=447962 RepID=A0AAD5U695_9FUNG|nr:hypothetical protein HK099_006337 [Clydaea vesicula]
MAKKGGKKKSAGANSAEKDDDALKNGEQQALNEITIQVYEAKIRDLNEKLDRYKYKCETLVAENLNLGSSQAKFSQDRQDIVEFLNIKVQDHEKLINTLEAQIRALEAEKKDMEAAGKQKLNIANEEYKAEVELLHIQCAKYKADLDQLSEFRGRKEDMEFQIRYMRQQLDLKEKEYKEVIHSMERKVLQDKNLMKKEMLQKVNEAVANFRRVADQQMAETTKRAIRENMAITAQLKKMSAKTMELIAENESLMVRVAKLKSKNSLLVDSEKDLARKNQANQRVIKMLVEKLKESDKMLEVAYDTGAFNLEENKTFLDEFPAPQNFNFTSSTAPSYPSSTQQQLKLSMVKEDTAIHQTQLSQQSLQLSTNEQIQDLKIKLESLKFANNLISNKAIDYQDKEGNTLEDNAVKNLSLKKFEEEEILNFIKEFLTTGIGGEGNSIVSMSSLKNMIDRIKSTIKIDVKCPDGLERKGRESLGPILQTNSAQKKLILTSTSPALGKRASPNLKTLLNHIPSTLKVLQYNEKLKENGEESCLNEECSNVLTIQNNISVEENDAVIHRTNLFSRNGIKMKSIAVQTRNLQFGPKMVKTDQLLSELRPWGPTAHCMPKKGTGLYCPRNHRESSNSSQYYNPQTVHSKHCQSSSELSLFEPTPSTTILFESNSSSSL